MDKSKFTNIAADWSVNANPIGPCSKEHQPYSSYGRINFKCVYFEKNYKNNLCNMPDLQSGDQPDPATTIMHKPDAVNGIKKNTTNTTLATQMTNNSMDDLIKLVNRLQDALSSVSLNNPIDLPQIVVIGRYSYSRVLM